jgi:hypothetical protein
MKTAQVTATCLSLLAVAGSALAQTPCPIATPDNCLTNPGFEQVDQFSSFGDPVGWHTLSNNDATCRRRTATDSLSPPAIIRTGLASMMIRTPGNSDFRGFTTDWRNFTIAGFPFYDPIFNYETGGDVVVSGWYYIPSTDPIVGDAAFIKLNVKRGNQDYATYDTITEGLSGEIITGHTDDQWRYYEVRWSIDSIREEVLFNQAEGFFTIPPFPDHLKITVGRFGFGSVASSGVIFWDDISFRQEPPAATCECAADYNADGGVDGADVEAFFTDWAASLGCSDVNQDGGTDGADVEAFFLVWTAGGC